MRKLIQKSLLVMLIGCGGVFAATDMLDAQHHSAPVVQPQFNNPSMITWETIERAASGIAAMPFSPEIRALATQAAETKIKAEFAMLSSQPTMITWETIQIAASGIAAIPFSREIRDLARQVAETKIKAEFAR